MKTILLSISASLFILNVNANELNTTSWNFPSPDQQQLSINRSLLFCDANPTKCPVGLSQKRGTGKLGSDSSLVDPKTSSSANNISVVLAGDNSSVTLSTSQDAKDNTMNTEASVDPVIDYNQVLNYTNK